jgi:hypothetical protein
MNVNGCAGLEGAALVRQQRQSRIQAIGRQRRCRRYDPIATSHFFARDARQIERTAFADHTAIVLAILRMKTTNARNAAAGYDRDIRPYPHRARMNGSGHDGADAA